MENVLILAVVISDKEKGLGAAILAWSERNFVRELSCFCQKITKPSIERSELICCSYPEPDKTDLIRTV